MRHSKRHVPAIAACLLLCILLVARTSAEGVDAALKPVVAEIVAGCEAAGARRVTVADFTDLKGDISELGRFLAEELQVSLFAAKPRFAIVDRANLRLILAEHKLNLSHLVDPATAKELGRLAGVDGIVTGTVIPLGETVRVTIKVIATDTATIMAAARSELPRTKGVDEVGARGVVGPGAQLSGAESAAAAGAPPGTAAVAGEQDEFRVAIRSCARRGTSVACTGTLTNTGQARETLSLFPLPYAVDSAGTQSSWTRVTIGALRDRNSQELEPDLPVTLVLAFDGLSPDARRVNVVVPLSSNRRYVGSKIVLRNVAIKE